MSKAELIFKYRHTIERMCKIKIRYFAINDDWYEIIDDDWYEIIE